MFNTVENNSPVNISTEIAFKDKYPSFTIDVKSVEIELASEWSWKKDTHKKITLNKGEFVGIIHNGMARFIKEGLTYNIWFWRRDNHDRFIEIALINKV